MTSAPAAAATTIVDLPFGHSVAVIRTDSGATLRIRAPGAQPDIELEIAVTSAGGATLRKRTLSARPAAPSTPPPASLIPTTSRVVPSTASVAPAPASAIPTSVVASAGSIAPPPLAAASEPRLSVQQYAALRAECLVAPPDHVAETRARYGLDEAGDNAEVEAWSRKFRQDPGLFESYKRLFQVFRNKAPASPATLASGAPTQTPRSSVMSTAALHRVLSLGEHATMAAELLVMPEGEVYAKHDLADPAVRSEVLRVCEQRLQDPATLETWKKLHAIAVAKQRRA